MSEEMVATEPQQQQPEPIPEVVKKAVSTGMANTIRPVNMDEVVGMEHNKQIIYYNIEGCKKLNEPLPSFICSGPAGTGKTTLAAIVAGLTGGDVYKFLGTDIKKPDNIYEIAALVKDNDVVFVEEAHTLNKQCQAVLLEWLEHFKLLGAGMSGALDAPKVCFLFPTTNAGKLTSALRTRCKSLHTSYYSIDDMKVILLRAAKKYGLDLEASPDALELLAQSSRGTPRIGLYHRLDPVRKIMAVEDQPFGMPIINKFFKTHNVNEWGLENNDLYYLNALYDKLEDGRGRPVSHKVMMQITGFEPDLLDSIIEAYLQQIGIIRITTQGRTLTDFGYQLIGKPPITDDPLDIIKSKSVDLNRLSELLKNEDAHSKGMKEIMQHFPGLVYGPDNPIMIAALNKLGYTARRRAGIVKMED